MEMGERISILKKCVQEEIEQSVNFYTYMEDVVDKRLIFSCIGRSSLEGTVFSCTPDEGI